MGAAGTLRPDLHGRGGAASLRVIRTQITSAFHDIRPRKPPCLSRSSRADRQLSAHPSRSRHMLLFPKTDVRSGKDVSIAAASEQDPDWCSRLSAECRSA